MRNGYLYEIDGDGRTRRVSGDISIKADQGRSRTAQRSAGGIDRRPGDHGGHYIARRFNGPTDAVNHFAQDAKFNRGDYRRLEEQWARAKRIGKSVRVKIVPVFHKGSQRPSGLNIWFWIDDMGQSLNLPNGSEGQKNAER
ncbi:DNA/RNA non-specific endonuclease [Allosphingosinicella vermicomposti]|uniref:DNA/RNA non-specific endonuclease n=1 Tax=Allosphingosinicella vermicomposti TaxID=614671 RepID=UPI000D0F4C81|nr:DNA/RNA non-specific endonuclease [Allosphingosinicella vermicomposti]